MAALPFDNTTVEVPVNAAINADNTVVFTLPEGAPVLAVFAGTLIASVNDTHNRTRRSSAALPLIR